MKLSRSGKSLAGVVRLLQSHQQPLFGALASEMNQARGLVFGQIVQTRFDNILGVVAHGECDSLRLLVHRALDDLILVGRGIGVVAANNALFIDGNSPSGGAFARTPVVAIFEAWS